MNEAIPDVLVQEYQSLISGLKLPDPDDRHVLAAAIRSGAQVIVTKNLKDFPASALERYDIAAQDPDEFVTHMIDLAPAAVVRVVTELASSRRKPPSTVEMILDRLAEQDLPQSIALLRNLL